MECNLFSSLFEIDVIRATLISVLKTQSELSVSVKNNQNMLNKIWNKINDGVEMESMPDLDQILEHPCKTVKEFEELDTKLRDEKFRKHMASIFDRF